MAAFDAVAADAALKRRATILREVGLAAAAEGHDIGHGPISWDGRSISFDWLWLAPDEPTPGGWFRYSQNYWLV